MFAWLLAAPHEEEIQGEVGCQRENEVCREMMRGRCRVSTPVFASPPLHLKEIDLAFGVSTANSNSTEIDAVQLLPLMALIHFLDLDLMPARYPV